jgi:hypothetical protein
VLEEAQRGDPLSQAEGNLDQTTPNEQSSKEKERLFRRFFGGGSFDDHWTRLNDMKNWNSRKKDLEIQLCAAIV